MTSAGRPAGQDAYPSIGFITKRHRDNLGIRLHHIYGNAGLTIPKLARPGGCKARGV